MNRIWTLIMLVAIAILTFTEPGKAVTSMLKAGEDAVTLAFDLMAIYVIWMGIMSIVEATGAGRFFGKLLRPVTRFLFGPQSPETYDYASLNISANLFGMGNAATPMGIRTIESMKKRADGSASDAMIMMMVVNATSLQLIPTTVISIRAAAGAASPSDILLPSLIATTITTFSGIVLAKLCARASRALEKRRELKKANAQPPDFEKNHSGGNADAAVTASPSKSYPVSPLGGKNRGRGAASKKRRIKRAKNAVDPHETPPGMLPRNALGRKFR